MGNTVSIRRNFPLQYTDCNVDIIGNYNLCNGEVINVDEATFPRLKPWEGDEMNLLDGYDTYEDTFLGQEGHAALNDLLKWIIVKCYPLHDHNISVVSKRGILRTIGYTAQHRRSEWRYKVCRFQGVIYISHCEASEPVERGPVLKASYAGTVFAGSRTEGGEENTYSYVVAECSFKDIKCLVAGEPDCKDSNGDFVEIKTTTVDNYERNCSRGWLQAYLLGNQKLVLGLRGSDFILRDVKVENVDDVPGKYGADGGWSGKNMLGFIHSVMCMLLDKVPEGGTCTLESRGEEEYHITVDAVHETFLNESYKQHLNKLPLPSAS